MGATENRQPMAGHGPSRFFGMGEPPFGILHRLTDSTDPRKAMTLLASRRVDGDSRLIAVASYFSLTHAAAEVALAVDDHFQGKGIGTLLLERLAAHAAVVGRRQTSTPCATCCFAYPAWPNAFLKSRSWT